MVLDLLGLVTVAHLHFFLFEAFDFPLETAFFVCEGFEGEDDLFYFSVSF
jgi:hypothetical protein